MLHREAHRVHLLFAVRDRLAVGRGGPEQPEIIDDDEIRHRRCARLRSEEHTSELQSLMRISYAVFCLKKKTKSTHISYTQNKHINIKQVTRDTRHPMTD